MHGMRCFLHRYACWLMQKQEGGFKELARYATGQSEPAAWICQKSSGRSLLRWEDSRASPARSPSLLP